MKKLFLTLCSLVMATASLWAQFFEVDGIYYNITDETNKTVEVTSGSPKYSGSVTIPSRVTYNDVAYSVTAIEGYAFYGCTELTLITIPESVTSIGRYAFYLSGLTEITISNRVTSIGESAFYNCKNLTTVNFNANNCTNMGSSSSPVFNGCNNLSSVNIGENVTRIPNYAFSSCTGLTSITLPNSIIEIGIYAFSSCTGLISVIIPNSVVAIGDFAFSSCTGLFSVTIPNSVTSISNSAFRGCINLTSVTIPNSVTEIGNSAFSGCTGLISVAIGNGVTSIEEFAFSGCTSLTEIIIPNGITSIGSSAFSGCTGLTMVTIADSDTELTIPSDAFPSPIPSLYMGRKINNIQQLDIEELIIGNNFTKVEENQFQGCSTIKKLTLGDGITLIETSAFEGCTGLTELIIPDNVTMIRNSAFSGCTALTSVSLGYGLTRIAGDVFKNCTNIDVVYCRATTPPGASTTTFPEVVQENAILYVPTGSESTYMTTSPWSNFWDIREQETLGVEDVLAEDVNLTIQNGAIVVNGLDEPIYIEVYNLHGQRVYSGYETTIPVNERGIYLVKIGNRVVKVVL